jgi:hypothetical protein
MRRLLGGRVKLWMVTIGFDCLRGGGSAERMMLHFLVFVEVDEVFFIGGQRAASGNDFASRYP